MAGSLGTTLTGMFVAPDPGLLRLRGAGRAVLGIGLAATVSGTAGQSLTMAVAGGLAALLALFTVADPTVRGQALTTALLPAAGCPVLALAVLLHDRPLPRDLAFLAVVGLGVYARRWGPRGNALGIFAFMCFFLAQFLHAVPAQLPGLYAAVALALLTSSAVRFGLWCYERRLPAPRPAPAPLGGRRLRRPTTRQAVQATVAGGLALAAGQALSHERWYWAVGTVWWIFVNTASRGETLVRGFRRVLGTAAGVVAGLGVAVPLHGEPAAAAVLVALCVAGIFYVAAVSYSWMIFFVTVLVGVLYGTLGTVDSGLLALRLLETLAGAAGAALAVLLVLPVTTHATTDAWIRRTLHCVHLCAVEAAGRLAGSPTADPAGRVAELEVLLGRVRLSVAPLVHPLSPLGHRRTRARRVLALLDACGREARGLASVAADPEGSRTERLTVACARVEAAVRALTVNGTTVTGPPRHPARPAADEPALAHLHGLERALAELAEPLRGRPRRPALAAR